MIKKQTFENMTSSADSPTPDEYANVFKSMKRRQKKQVLQAFGHAVESVYNVLSLEKSTIDDKGRRSVGFSLVENGAGGYAVSPDYDAGQYKGNIAYNPGSPSPNSHRIINNNYSISFVGEDSIPTTGITVGNGYRGQDYSLETDGLDQYSRISLSPNGIKHGDAGRDTGYILMLALAEPPRPQQI